ncbi:hypothetical protein VE03_03563 [Pseudogymnoascus sp. 23342-1-I1]|nr:hypothetical protein VE03_03690 [Pseudogymnoascus sp. 23342-1-I1]OBT66543.1 hypothetical protein VE03_03563 [Pseudogymnoascus sp. 23342-1-I1]
MSKPTQKTEGTKAPEARLSSPSPRQDQTPHVTLRRKWAAATSSEAQLETRLLSQLSEATSSKGVDPMERWEKETQQESPWNNVGGFQK